MPTTTMHVLNQRGLSPTLHRSQSMNESRSPERVILGVVTTNSVIIRSNVIISSYEEFYI